MARARPTHPHAWGPGHRRRPRATPQRQLLENVLLGGPQLQREAGASPCPRTNRKRAGEAALAASGWDENLFDHPARTKIRPRGQSSLPGDKGAALPSGGGPGRSGRRCRSRPWAVAVPQVADSSGHNEMLTVRVTQVPRRRLARSPPASRGEGSIYLLARRSGLSFKPRSFCSRSLG